MSTPLCTLRSTISTAGSGRAVARSGSSSSPRRPSLRRDVRLQRRRRRAEERHRAGAVRAQQRHVARVVAHALLLLERAVVLLVDDDDAEVGDRREQRRARAERDVDLPAREAPPRVGARRVGEPGVQHRDASPKRARKRADELRRQRDLGHEHERASGPRASAAAIARR